MQTILEQAVVELSKAHSVERTSVISFNVDGKSFTHNEVIYKAFPVWGRVARALMRHPPLILKPGVWYKSNNCVGARSV